jgi:hypothetical protein
MRRIALVKTLSRCKAHSALRRAAAFPSIDSSGFESYSLKCQNCGAILCGVIDPFDGKLLLTLMEAASNDAAPIEVIDLP